MPNNKRLFLKYYIENIQNMLYIDSFFLKLINQLLLFQVWFIFLKVQYVESHLHLRHLADIGIRR